MHCFSIWNKCGALCSSISNWIKQNTSFVQEEKKNNRSFWFGQKKRTIEKQTSERSPTLHKRWCDIEKWVAENETNKSIHCARIVGHYSNITTNTFSGWQKLLLKIIYEWCAIIYVHLCNNTIHPPIHSFVHDYYLSHIHSGIRNSSNRCGRGKSNGLRCGGMVSKRHKIGQ